MWDDLTSGQLGDRVRSCPPSQACHRRARSAGTRCPSDWRPAVRAARRWWAPRHRRTPPSRRRARPGAPREVETVEELLAQEGLHQVQAPDDLHVLVPVTDPAHRAGQIRAELRRPGPREAGPVAGGHVLRDAVEERGDLTVHLRIVGPPPPGQILTTEKRGYRTSEMGPGFGYPVAPGAVRGPAG
jgi:hypothetical protein